MGSARAEMTKDAGEYLVTQAATRPTNDAGQDGGNNSDILVVARQQVLQRGEGLNQDQVLAVLQLPDDRLEELLALAHEVRMRWCGPEVEVEGIISLKTGGCPEDCHFCSQSGLFASPVRSAWLDIPSLVEAAKQTAKSGATEFCIVAAVRGPDERLMAQVAAGIEAIRNEVEINIACSLGMLTAEQVDQLAARGCIATTTTSKRRARSSPTSSPPTPGKSAGRRYRWCVTRAWRFAAAASSAWGDAAAARGIRRRACRAGPRRGPAELPQPAARYPVRRPGGNAGR